MTLNDVITGIVGIGGIVRDESIWYWVSSFVLFF